MMLLVRLCSFLYNLNYDLDPTARVNSGSMIQVQIFWLNISGNLYRWAKNYTTDVTMTQKNTEIN